MNEGSGFFQYLILTLFTLVIGINALTFILGWLSAVRLYRADMLAIAPWVGLGLVAVLALFLVQRRRDHM